MAATGRISGRVNRERIRMTAGGAERPAAREKVGGAMWSPLAEEQFFDALATTSNVRAAAAEVGFTTPTIYRQRRLRADFAARFDAALAQGYSRLEAALLETAIDSVEDHDFDASRPIPKMTVEQAMNVLRAHRNAVMGSERGGPGRRARPRSLDEVRAGILRKVEAIRQAAREAEDATAGEVDR